MSRRQPSNMAASVRDRLLHRAKERGEDYNALLVRYATERFLYRLGVSDQRDRFILKGAMLFVLWEGDLHRITRDVDLLGTGSEEVDDVVAAVREICAVTVEDDGLEFHPDTAKGTPIREGQAYEGVRVRVLATLGNARLPLQIDVGFGDAITPGIDDATLPTLLDFPSPRLAAYPRETVVAEKVQAMVLLGIANTRMKDFYDVDYLARHFDFEGQSLVEALRATFARRGTPLPDSLPLALSEEFATDSAKRAQWAAFLKKGKLDVGDSFGEVISRLRLFLLPPLEAAQSGGTLDRTWRASGPWT